MSRDFTPSLAFSLMYHRSFFVNRLALTHDHIYWTAVFAYHPYLSVYVFVRVSLHVLWMHITDIGKYINQLVLFLHLNKQRFCWWEYKTGSRFRTTVTKFFIIYYQICGLDSGFKQCNGQRHGDWYKHYMYHSIHKGIILACTPTWSYKRYFTG